MGELRMGSHIRSSTSSLITKYPGIAALQGTSERVFLHQGKIIDRYGDLDGRWFSIPGITKGARSIPLDQGPYMKFQVLKPFEVSQSLASPGMLSGQTGFGIQFRSPVSAQTLIKKGIIKPIK
jgi:hypothetical protein